MTSANDEALDAGILWRTTDSSKTTNNRTKKTQFQVEKSDPKKKIRHKHKKLSLLQLIFRFLSPKLQSLSLSKKPTLFSDQRNGKQEGRKKKTT